MKFWRLYQFWTALMYLSYRIRVDCWSINATGGSFPSNVYRQAAFAYEFQPSGDFVSYFGAGSTTGKCNIMGYWHTGDTLPSQSSISAAVKQRDQLICTDECTVATCGISSEVSPRFDRLTRRPLIDFAGSDSILKSADYSAFSDLQMLPALAGAVVPVYNIPELRSIKNASLVLSRQNMADIFKGRVLFWNDTRILKNNPLLRETLKTVSHPIHVIVRTDSSGTSEIFSTALSMFDPVGLSAPDYSFGATVGISSNPSWCGSLTDEVQIFTITGCNTAASVVDKLIYMKVVDGKKSLRDLNFLCDASAANITGEFLRSNPGAGLSVIVSKTTISSGVIKLQVGYGDPSTIGNYWYKPSIVALPPGVAVEVSTLQEGGYYNSHYNSTYFVTPQVQSIWIVTSVSNFQFNVSWHSTSGRDYTIGLDAHSTAADIALAFNTSYLGSVDSVRLVNSTSQWKEYQVTFSSVGSKTFSKFSAVSALKLYDNAVYITTLLDYNNYPTFYDFAHPMGFGGSGRYSCYLRQYGYRRWNFFTANKNAGMIAAVYITPYTIGYSVLSDATRSALNIASIINKANVVVTASATSVAYAVMDKGGNLNSQMNAVLADASSSNAWPITGFTYYVIRTQTHIGSCERRIAAMKYLYNYYYSDAVKNMAAELGFATLPVFIRDIIAQKLVSTARCNNGQLALSEYNKNPTTIVASTTFKEIAKSYAAVYSAVDPSVDWNFVSLDDSRLILKEFDAAPHLVAGVVTMFTGRKEKLKYLSNPNILTFTFSHVPAVNLYHLDHFSECAHTPLRITNDILIGIYSGTITDWDDAKIQEANFEFRSCLPSMMIHLVVLSTPSDENSVFYQYLSRISPDFNNSYYSQGGDGSYQYYNFSSVIPSSRLTTVTANAYVDNVIISQDGTFGFFLHVGTPSSTIASYCADSACNTGVIVPNDYGASVALCQLDPDTVINPSKNIFTYDLMVSKSVGCYPIVGTVDISMNSVNSKNSCTPGNSAYSVTVNKVKFGSFLFRGSVIIKPLALVSNAPSTSMQRRDAFMSICDQTCNGVMMGYAYCGYRDCSWEGGDYIQLVSGCLAGTQRRHVSYIRTNSTCVLNPLTSPQPIVQISCTYVLPDSSVAIGAIFMAVMGALVCSVILYLSFKYSYEKVLRRSQLIFIYFFLVGAVLMNLTVLCMYGPNSDSNCMLRVWAVNLASTLMFAPLIMKLHRVDVLFRTLQRGGRRKTISDFTVGLQVLGLFSVDLAILVAWTIVDRPRSILVSSSYKDVYVAIDDLVCSTNINQPFEKAMVAWKAVLLLFGIIKSIQTWEVPKEISEAKHFAIAIYNIAVVGSFSYFLSVFGNVGIDVIVILRCVGIFISATVSAVVIMTPKLVIIQLSWTEVFLGSASSFKDDCSYTSSTPNIPAQLQIQDTIDVPRQKMRLSANLMGAITTNLKIRNLSNDEIDMCGGGSIKNREVAI